MKLLVLLFLAPVAAYAQGMSLTAPGQATGGRVLWSAPFAVPGCYASGQTAGASSAITTTRASVATYIDGSGNLQTCQNDELRVSTDGAIIEPARRNVALRSVTMSTAAIATNPFATSGATVTTVAGSGPAGSGTWAELTSTTNAGQMYQITTSASSATFAASAWAAKASGTGYATVGFSCGAAGGNATACSCVRSDGGTCTASTSALLCRAKVADLGTTPVRIAAIGTCTNATTGPIFYVSPGNEGVATGTSRFTGAQLEAGTTATSLIVTAGAVGDRALDAVSATIPSVPSKGWCISGNWKPTSGTWPGALSLWTLGTNYNDANAASSWGNSSIYIVDAASGVLDLGDYTDPVAPWKIVTCNANGKLSLAVNGVMVDDSSTGAGTGILTTPATTLHFGAQANGGTIGQWAIKDVKVWSAKSTKDASK